MYIANHFSQIWLQNIYVFVGNINHLIDFCHLQYDLIRCSSIRPPSILSRARQKAFDLGLQDFIVVSAKSGLGMEELFGRIVTLVRSYLLHV